MASWPIFDANVWTAWADLMINALWQGSLGLVFIGVLLRLFPRIHPAVQCWLWRLACLKPLIALIGFKPIKLHYHLQIGLRQLGWLLVNAQPSRHLGEIAPSFWKSAPPLQVSNSRTGFWFLLWLTGQIVILAGLFYVGRRRQKSGCNYVPITDPVIISLYQDLGRRANCRKIPQLFTAEGISSPMLQGILHAKIIIPASVLTDLAADELRMILAHELAHYKRGDLFWNWLPTLARTVFFFHPCIWRVEKKLAQLQEICCDRLAVQYSKTPAVKFGRMLLRFSIRQELPETTGLTAGFGSPSLEMLKNRLKALQSVDPTNRKRMVIAGIVLLMLGGFAVLPWQLVQAQPIPVNLLVINYSSQGRHELSAHVMLPDKEIKKITVLVDGKRLSADYNANGMYLSFARPDENNFPLEGPHQVTVKAQTSTGMIMDQDWIFFHDSMVWSSQHLGLESNKTLIKIGPFFWVVNNRNKFLSLF